MTVLLLRLVMIASAIYGVAVPPLPGSAHRERSRAVPQRPGTVSLSGRVVADDGRPVVDAEVRASNSEVRFSDIVQTDENGHYGFTGIPAGRYAISARKPAYVDAFFGQLGPLEPSRTLEVAAGTTGVADLNMTRGGTVGGTVLNARGEPAVGVEVRVLQKKIGALLPYPTVVGAPSLTDDKGDYRIFGLAPGRYFVVAAQAQSAGTGPKVQRGSATVPTYFPGTRASASAAEVTVQAAQTTSASFALVAGNIANISGRLSPSCGVGGETRSAVTARSVAGLADRTSQVAPDGSFLLTGMAPGDYAVDARISYDLERGGATLCRARIHVEDGDLQDVTLSPMPISRVSGRVVVGAAQAAVLASSNVTIVADTFDVALLPNIGGGGRVNSDGSFQLSVYPGRSVFRVRIDSQPFWVTLSVRYKGRDITDEGTVLRDGETASGLAIEISSVPTVLTGQVEPGGQSAAPVVVVFPADPTKWGFTRYASVVRADSDRRFRVRYLPPGKYRVVALDRFGTGEWADKDLLMRLATSATTVELGDGATRDVLLKVTSR